LGRGEIRRGSIYILIGVSKEEKEKKVKKEIPRRVDQPHYPGLDAGAWWCGRKEKVLVRCGDS
jgi:hypothetical protein